MKNKLITLGLFIIFSTGVSAQSIYEKNGYWGVQYGANINIPTEKRFITGTLFFYTQGPIISQKIYHVKLKPAIGQYVEVSRAFRVSNINETSIVYLEPILNFSQINYNYSYEELDNTNSPIDLKNESITNNAISFNLKLKHLFAPQQKNSLFYALNCEIGYFHPSIPLISSTSKYYRFITCGFEIGYSFLISNFLFSPIIQYEVFSFRKNFDDNYDYWGPSTGHPDKVYHKRYTILKAGVMLNF